MKLRFTLALAAICMLPFDGGLLWAQEESEEDFFGSAEVDVGAGEAEVKNLAEELDRERLGLSGNLEAAGTARHRSGGTRSQSRRIPQRR